MPAIAPTPSRARLYAVAGALVVVLAALGFWASAQRASAKTAADSGIRTVRAEMGSAANILRIAGSTSAREFASIAAPMMRGPDSGRQLVLISLVKSGALVRKGEVIAQIDAQSIKDHVDDIDSQVQQAQSDITKRKAEQEIEMENLRQSLRVAEANLAKAKYDAGASAIRTAIDREMLSLAVEEAQATYNGLRANLATTMQKQKSEIRILEYTRDRQARHRDRHKHDAEKFTMHAPIGGLAVMQSIWRGGDMGQVQEGDQVSPGQPFMKIVNTGTMQLEAKVNQAESEGIRIGQTAEVHFDAFPGLTLPGKVYSVGALGVGGWRQNFYIRNIPVNVALLQSDARIIPDLSGSADVVLDSAAKSVVIPLEALQKQGERTVVFVKEGDLFRERTVELGRRNHVQAAVVSGLRAGEEVALGRPRVVSQ